jgi:hypothetical protein
MQRFQRIFVVQRNSDKHFWIAEATWTNDIRLARIVSRTKFKNFVRLDIGGDLENYSMIEVEPCQRTMTTKNS